MGGGETETDEGGELEKEGDELNRQLQPLSLSL
jgi:hypothetical protein